MINVNPEHIKHITRCGTKKDYYRIIVSDQITYTELDDLHKYAKSNYGDKYVIRRQYKNEVEIYPNTLRR